MIADDINIEFESEMIARQTILDTLLFENVQYKLFLKANKSDN